MPEKQQFVGEIGLEPKLFSLSVKRFNHWSNPTITPLIKGNKWQGINLLIKLLPQVTFLCAENWTRTNNSKLPKFEVTLKHTTIREHLSEYKICALPLSYLRILPFKDRAYPLYTPLSMYQHTHQCLIAQNPRKMSYTIVHPWCV